MDKNNGKMKATIYVEPIAKGRARSTIVNGNIKTYTPAKTRNAEALIVASIRTAMRRFAMPFGAGVPLKLEATFFRDRPKSLAKKVTMPVSRPDVDNYTKLLVDALNKFLFPDDSQITTMLVKKRFAFPGTVPRIELEITEDLSQ